MMPSPLQPIVQAGKRGFAAFEAADAFSGVKRACGGFDGFRQSFDIENMAPPQAFSQSSAGQGYVGYGGVCSQPTYSQQYTAQHGCQLTHQQQQQQHGQRQVGDSMMECPDMSCDMDMDSAGSLGQSRYERFPSKTTCGTSPTHYHKKAIGFIPPLFKQSGGGADESMVRTWECEYMGKNDYY